MSSDVSLKTSISFVVRRLRLISNERSMLASDLHKAIREEDGHEETVQLARSYWTRAVVTRRRDLPEQGCSGAVVPVVDPGTVALVRRWGNGDRVAHPADVLAGEERNGADKRSGNKSE